MQFIQKILTEQASKISVKQYIFVGIIIDEKNTIVERRVLVSNIRNKQHNTGHFKLINNTEPKVISFNKKN